MYESPIMILQDQIATDFARKIDEETGKAIYEATQRIGINVDDNELLKALRYDRGQYDKGYNDGFNDGRKAIIAEIIEQYGDEVTE